MATSPQSFALDRSVFNQSLYSRMRDFWFAGLPSDARVANMEVVQKWYGGPEQPPGQKEAFDNHCRDAFEHALDAVGPTKLSLPEFESFEKDIEDAALLAKPFLAEVQDTQAQDEKEGAETLLALILLFDQMPRNIYRDVASMRVIFNHYDRLSRSLLYSSMRLQPSPLDYTPFRRRPVVSSWYYMPLLHSEYLPAHEQYYQISTDMKKDNQDDEESVAYIDRSLKYGSNRRDQVQRFGRMPHRNEALGRQNTTEETEYLERGGLMLGSRKEDDKPQGKDEL